MQTPDPIPALKAELARILVEELAHWSQWNAAVLLETDQPRMSDLRNGRLGRFSLERLIRFISRIGGDVHVSVTWTKRRRCFRKSAAAESRGTGRGREAAGQ